MRGLALPPVTLVLSPLAVSPRVEDVIAFAFLFLSLSLNPDFYSPSSPPPGGRQRPTRLSLSLPGPGFPFPAPQIDSPSGKSGAQWGAAGAAGSAGGERLAASRDGRPIYSGRRWAATGGTRPTESRKVIPGQPKEEDYFYANPLEFWILKCRTKGYRLSD